MAEVAKEKKRNASGNYFTESFQELRKVTWPTRARAVRLTFLVIGFCLAIALLIGVLDFAFSFGYRQLLDLGPDRALPASTTPFDTGSPVDITTGGEPLDLGEVKINEGGDATVTVQ